MRRYAATASGASSDIRVIPGERLDRRDSKHRATGAKNSQSRLVLMGDSTALFIIIKMRCVILFSPQTIEEELAPWPGDGE